MMFVLFILGFFISWQGLLYVVVPIFLPVAASLGFNPLWFGLSHLPQSADVFSHPALCLCHLFCQGRGTSGSEDHGYLQGSDSLCHPSGLGRVSMHRLSRNHSLAATGDHRKDARACRFFLWRCTPSIESAFFLGHLYTYIKYTEKVARFRYRKNYGKKAGKSVIANCCRVGRTGGKGFLKFQAKTGRRAVDMNLQNKVAIVTGAGRGIESGNCPGIGRARYDS